MPFGGSERHWTGSVHRRLTVIALVTASGGRSTPFMHMKPAAHSLKLDVMPPSANVVFVLGTKNAQVPPHKLAPSSATVGAVLTVKAVVAAFGALTAATVVPGVSTPVLAAVFTLMSITGAVTVGWLDVDGRYNVVPGVPAYKVAPEATRVAVPLMG